LQGAYNQAIAPGIPRHFHATARQLLPKWNFRKHTTWRWKAIRTRCSFALVLHKNRSKVRLSDVLERQGHSFDLLPKQLMCLILDILLSLRTFRRLLNYWLQEQSRIKTEQCNWTE